jgi:putative ABC transport system substrate-binding protein
LNRRAFLVVFCALPAAGYAQTAVPTVGVLWIDDSKASPYITALTAGLRERGYVPGRNVRIDDRFIVKAYEELPDAAARLVASKPDLIVAYGGTANLALQKVTARIPVVMVSAGDPVKLGLAKSLSRPGMNFTGLTNLNADLSPKRLELLKETQPKLRRVAVALYPQSEAEPTTLKAYEAAARRMSVETHPLEINNAAEIASAIASTSKLHVDAIAFVGSTLFRAHAAQIVAEVGRTGLPAVYSDDVFADAGGLLSYGVTIADNFRQSATYVDKILKGANPGDLPVEQPVRVSLVVNMRTAKAQGIDIPRALLARADRVIE